MSLLRESPEYVTNLGTGDNQSRIWVNCHISIQHRTLEKRCRNIIMLNVEA